jgi:hypothetical protein
MADSAAACDPSYSTSRRASPRGLGYFYSTTWAAARLRSDSGASQDTFFKMTLQFERKYSTQGSGAPCHVSFGSFSPDFSGFSCQDFRRTLSQSLRLNLRLWSAILQSHLHISSGFKTRRAFFEDLRRQYSRTLGNTREDFKIAQTSAGVHSSLGMLRLLLRTFDL